MSQASVLKLYDLAGAEEARRTSPFCWRVKLAIAYKGIPCESLPWRRVEKDMIAFSGQGKVPVLVHSEQCVSDSWHIAEYLEKLSGTDSLLGNTQEKHALKFTINWVDETLVRAIQLIVSHDAIAVSAEKDKGFYRDKLENKLNIDLEVVGATKENMESFHQALAPICATIQDHPFLGGSQPNFADFAVAGAFVWARSVSAIQLLSKTDPVYAWRQRIFAMFQQELDNTLGYDYQ